MNDKRMKDALEAIARRGVPENTNLWPNLLTKLERKSPMTTLRTRPLAAVLIALMVLLTLSGVAYALGKVLGYIPGYGIVEENVQMVVLAEPVSQTRDGITITVEELILTSDTLYSTITSENIPSNLFVPMMDTITVTCKGDWVYELPDGSRLLPATEGNAGTMDDSWSNGDDTRLSYRGHGYFTFAKPVNLKQVTDLTLHIPCVASDLPAGSLPENWEFHLRFVPAPKGLTALTAFPVVDYMPSPIDTSAPENLTATPEVNPISITRMIDTGDGYVLMGEVAPPPGSVNDYNSELRLFDANGQQIFWDMPMDIQLGTPTAHTPFAQVFAMQFRKADVSAFPLVIQLVAKKWEERTPLRFEFDAGEHPQPGGEWKIDQTFTVDGHSVTLNSIRVVEAQMPANAGGFQFVMSFSDYDISVTPGIEGYPSLNEGFSGGGSSDTQAPPPPHWSMNYSVEFAAMPEGKMIVILEVRVMVGEQTWSLQWQP